MDHITFNSPHLVNGVHLFFWPIHNIQPFLNLIENWFQMTSEYVGVLIQTVRATWQVTLHTGWAKKPPKKCPCHCQMLHRWAKQHITKWNIHITTPKLRIMWSDFHIVANDSTPSLTYSSTIHEKLIKMYWWHKTTTSKIKAKVVNSLFINSDLIACIDADDEISNFFVYK